MNGERRVDHGNWETVGELGREIRKWRNMVNGIENYEDVK